MYIMCPYLDACVFVCVEGEEDAGIRGIVQYVYFIDVSFSWYEINCVNYKKHSPLKMLQMLPDIKDWYLRGDEQIC